MAAPFRNWFWSEATVRIASLLLDAEPDTPLRTDEIADTVQLGERMARELLGRLHAGRLVTRDRVMSGEAGRPAWCYWLSDEERIIAKRAVDTPPALWPERESVRPDSDLHADDRSTADRDWEDPSAPTSGGSRRSATARSVDAAAHASQGTVGMLGPGQEIVAVDISGPAYAHLLEALCTTTAPGSARWLWRVGSELAFVFDGEDAVADASELLAVLAGARLSVRQATVTQVLSPGQLTSQAHTVSPAVRRARRTRDASDAPQ